MFENKKVLKIIEKFEKIWAIETAISLMEWDMETSLPETAFSERGEAIGMLEGFLREFYTNEEIKKLVNEAEKEELNEFERGVLRVLKREIEKYEKLDKDFLRKEKKATAEALKNWKIAKKRSDFKVFQPYLEKVFEIEKEKAERLGYEEHPYDALLDLFEEGLRVKKANRIFSEIKKLKNLYKKLCKDFESPLEREKFEWEKCFEMVRYIVKKIGYDLRRGCIGIVAHPMTEVISQNDIRISIWKKECDFREVLFAGVHEAGHAIYYQQIDRNLWKTPLFGSASYGISESQARFYENVICRTKEFVMAFYEIFEAFLPFVENYSLEDIYNYFTIVRPCPIRVKSDEVQYNLHILIRYEIERDLFEEKIKIDELPEIWNEKMQKYLNITPRNDSEGVLQDVHWSLGYFGYFPSYTIGNIVAAQLIFEDLESLILRKDFGRIKEYLRRKIHKWGKTYPPEELLRKTIGEGINPEKFMEYIKRKYFKHEYV